MRQFEGLSENTRRLGLEAVEPLKEQKRKGRNIHSSRKVMYCGSSRADVALDKGGGPRGHFGTSYITAKEARTTWVGVSVTFPNWKVSIMGT